MRLIDFLLKLEPDQYSWRAWLHRNPDATLSRAFTWLEMKNRTANAALFLLDHAVRPGDRVVNLGSNSLEWAILDLACSAINAVHVPLDPRMPVAMKDRCLERLEPSLVFYDGSMQDQISPSSLSGRSSLHVLQSLRDLPPSKTALEKIAQPYESTDAANILFTSGTTGTPRGVMLSHRNLVSNAKAKLDAMPQSRHDQRLNFLPFSHAYARTCELSAWLVSHSSIEVVHGIEGVMKLAPIVHPTLINGVPLFYERLVREWDARGGTLPALESILGTRVRRLASGGASLPDPLRARLAEVGLPVYQGYGQTETSPVVCSNRAGSDHGSSTPHLIGVGPPVAGVQVRIDGESRLWVSGDGVMLGYWQDPDATQSKVVDGWLDTGDLAEYVEPGRDHPERSGVCILGRADDTIVLSSGDKIEPLPIELALNAQPWISNCLVVGGGYPYPILIVRPSALGKHLALEDLHSNVVNALGAFPRYAIPRRLLVVEAAWTSDNGLANFKGGPMRKRIEAYFQAPIQKTYARSQPLHSIVHTAV